MVALILAAGDVPSRTQLDGAWPGWDAGVDLVVAADGGARFAHVLGHTVDVWVGDGDSIDPTGLATLASSGVALERWPSDKDASDTDLAIDAAMARGASSIVIVGALGGPRIDHALVNIGLLARPDRLGRVSILDERSRLTAIGSAIDGEPGSLRLAGGPGDTVSLLAIDPDVAGVTTAGLRYPLVNEPLEIGSSRGLSNVIERPSAEISIRRGRLLVVESPATL